MARIALVEQLRFTTGEIRIPILPCAVATLVCRAVGACALIAAGWLFLVGLYWNVGWRGLGLACWCLLLGRNGLLIRLWLRRRHRRSGIWCLA